MKKRVYRKTLIKDLDVALLIGKFQGPAVVLAVDVAKTGMVAVFADPSAEHDQRVVTTAAWQHPVETPTLLAVLKSLQEAGKAVEAVMEPSGTYGDVLREQLWLHGVAVYRVGSKRTHDAAEVYDGVPSMHDVPPSARTEEDANES